MKNFLLFVVSIALAVVFMPWLGQFYEFITGGPVGSTILGIGNAEYAEGFLMGYAFFITLLLWIFGTGMKKYVVIISLAAVFLLEAMIGAFGILLVQVITVLIAWGIAEFVIRLRKK